MSYHRMVVKLGTRLLTSGTDHLDLSLMAKLVEQIAGLHHRGREIIIVSSGAVAAGRQGLKGALEHKNTPFKQVLASVGQSHLMHAYEQLFSQHDITLAQALLTRRDLSDRSGYLNARNTLLALFGLGVIPVVNENDVVATDELEGGKFGDNDELSAMVANLVDADVLVLLTDIAGLYTADPHYNSDVQLISRVEHFDEQLYRLATGSAYPEGTGGMLTKVEAAKLATSSGAEVIIADGRESDVLYRIDNGEQTGTFFPAQSDKMESRKRWMLSGLSSRGEIVVDRGAARALREHKGSLLPAGIIAVKGDFQRADIVDILSEKGKHIASGITNYGSGDVKVIQGKQSHEIPDSLGYGYGDEVVHRDNMVVL
jgi:glutamate 5-kinase